MKSSLPLLLGAIGIAGLFASAQALAQDDNRERSGSSHEHAAPQPQEHGYTGSRGPSQPQYAHPSYGAPQHGAPMYHGPSGYDRGPSYGHSPYDRGPGYGGAYEHNYRSPPMHAAPGAPGYGHYGPPNGAHTYAHGTVRGRGPSVAFRTFSGFRGRHVAALSVHDRELWRGGGWRHERYHGRLGWWWVVNGAWFFYDDPVYPYPDYISDYAYDDYDGYDDGDYDQGEYGQGQYGPGNTAWYCQWPQGYYPDVQYCSGPWQPVPMQ